jgi:hypothetical protein
MVKKMESSLAAAYNGWKLVILLKKFVVFKCKMKHKFVCFIEKIRCRNAK